MPTLDFKGKQFIYAHHLTVPCRTLEIDAKKSHIGENPPSLDDNLIVHGDNLHALKALLPKYAGKIKCIYIDPPYNTGNENWIYNDNVNSPMMQTWLEKNSPIDIEDLERHDKWLCMMWPRLHLLRESLSQDGVIFISIDDNEVHRLRMLMEEIFGEANFIACLPTVMNLKGNNDEFGFAGTHEYTVSWAKDRNFAQIGEFQLDDEELESWSEDDYGYYKKGANLKSTGGNAPRIKRPNLYYPIFVNQNDEVSVTETPKDRNYEKVLPITADEEMSWRWSKQKVSDESYNVIVERTDSGINLFKKQRPSLGDLPTKKPKSLFYKPQYSSGNGTAVMKQIFGRKVFNNPKPIQLLKDLVSLSTKQNDIILDSFAGSGTTAHAVLALNKQDGGNRKFILVECEDYADNITAERVRRVINGVENAKDENLQKGLGGSFAYCTLGDKIDTKGMLTGDSLPTYETLARYIAYTATGSKLKVKAVNRLNPRFVLELSATPQLGISNILVNITGTALKEEEMIKIPIQLRNFPNSDWKYTLAEAKTERDKLENIAKQFQQDENRYIHPIAVIRVDRTGKKQRDGIKVHALDARDELIKVLGVPEEHIKIKSSEQDELAGVDLLSPFCPVRYIITKDALKEGWDCPFAYQLALLDNTTAQTAMTQLIGRVMRQPHARATDRYAR